MTSPPTPTSSLRSILRKIRTRTEDSALVYFVLESHEGICSYSTLPFKPGDAHRDLVLRIPPGFEEEVQEALAPLGDKIYELATDE
jgi:hypothetical protein